jgi:hypothetical protein
MFKVSRIKCHGDGVLGRLVNRCAGGVALGNAQSILWLADGMVRGYFSAPGQKGFFAIRTNELQRVQFTGCISDGISS